MKKNELMTGDIVVTRTGNVAVVIRNGHEDYLMYESSGWETLDYFDDDMVFTMSLPDEEMDCIMQVYRSASGISFSDFEDEVPIYERDQEWVGPTADERLASAINIHQQKKDRLEKIMRMMEKSEAERKASNKFIYVVAQAYYGNRTGIEIRRDEIEDFLSSRLNDDSPAVLKAVRVPGNNNIVVVYDQTQEDEYINHDFPELYAKFADQYREDTGKEMTMHITCEIPEINFKIHTRCFACRMDENGVFQSLEDGDGEKYIHYFPIR